MYFKKWIHCAHHQCSVWRWKRYTGIRLALQSDVFDTFLLLLSTFRTFFCSGPLLLLCRMKLSKPKLFWPFTKSMNYSIWLLKIMPEILKCTKYAAASPSSCKANCNQSHYREVPRWEIFMEQELRFGLDLGRFGNFWGRFFHVFMGKKFFLKTF